MTVSEPSAGSDRIEAHLEWMIPRQLNRWIAFHTMCAFLDNNNGLLKWTRVITGTLILVALLSTPLFGQGEKPKIYGVLIDNTRSLEKQFPQVTAITNSVAARTCERGLVSLFSFTAIQDSSYFFILYETERYEGGYMDRAVGKMGIDWTNDATVLRRYVDRLSIVKGNTDLFGAIHIIGEALDVKSETSKTVKPEKIIILITDGEHRMEQIGISQPTETDDERRKRDSKLRKYLKDSGITVYAIGLTGELDTGSIHHESPRLRAENFLTKLTKATGGRVIFSRSKNAKIEALVDNLLRP